jgi:phosphopantetheinyl transferase (holo-ACP synthase)
MWEFLTSPEGPWWGEASIAGTFVIIGALLSLITSFIVDRSKAKRELARRFDNDIREAGAAFLTKADDYVEKAEHAQHAVERPAHWKDYTANLREALAARRAAQEAFAKALHPLSFVAPHPLVRAARVHRIQCVTAALSDEILTQATREELNSSRQKVVDEIRRTIKLPALKPSRRARLRRVLVAQTKQWTKKSWMLGGAAVVGVLLLGMWIGSLIG